MVEKTLALKAKVCCFLHHVCFLTCRLHLSALESESLCPGFDALRSVAHISCAGDAEASPVHGEVADRVAGCATVTVPAALMVACFVA